MQIRRKLLIAASALACSSLATVSYAQDKGAASKEGAAQKQSAAQKDGSAPKQTSPAKEGTQKQASAKKGGQNRMSFFITSAGPGKGADLGGLAGADKHCQDLAAKVGAGNRTWRAYLSTSSAGGGKPVNARDRIGKGPWYNAKGEMVAKNVDDLHFNANITRETALTENGEMVTARGTHDMLTGTDSQGRAFPGDTDTTCGNWTKSGEGSAILGHHDRRGLDERPHSKSWVQAHPSIGCSPDALRKTGGSGLFYCFAAR